ncbi:hypothetical protein V1511DRAFT_491873 [Dipodascopsis uninucleata]
MSGLTSAGFMSSQVSTATSAGSGHVQRVVQHQQSMNLTSVNANNKNGSTTSAIASTSGKSMSTALQESSNASGDATGAGKRKRRKRGRSKKNDDSDTDEGFSFEGMKTKSGRKVHKPQTFDAIDVLPDNKRRSLRQRRDLQTCRICLRGHSPDSNLIVFCDGCNDPYHQLCHDPPIDRVFIQIAEAQWFCAQCQSKMSERPLQTGLSGQNLSETEKRTYLLSLPVKQLVELILMCEREHPDLKIYSPNIKNPIKASTSSDSSQLLPKQKKVVLDDVTPLPGAGSQIGQPSEADMQYMLDDNNTVFSHKIYDMPNINLPHEQQPQQMQMSPNNFHQQQYQLSPHQQQQQPYQINPPYDLYQCAPTHPQAIGQNLYINS